MEEVYGVNTVFYIGEWCIPTEQQDTCKDSLQIRTDYRSVMIRIAPTAASTIIGNTVEMLGLGKDGSEFHIELSVVRWKTREGMFLFSHLLGVEAKERKRNTW